MQAEDLRQENKQYAVRLQVRAQVQAALNELANFIGYSGIRPRWIAFWAASDAYTNAHGEFAGGKEAWTDLLRKGEEFDRVCGESLLFVNGELARINQRLSVLLEKTLAAGSGYTRLLGQ